MSDTIFGDLGSLGSLGGTDSFGTIEPEEVIEAPAINTVTIDTIYNYVNSFISLDISVHGTGWSKWRDGVHTFGHFGLVAPSEDLTGRRREYRQRILELIGEDEYDYMFIEEPIGSINFVTARILYQLHAIPDDLVDMGYLNVHHIIRENNTAWKSELYQVSGYKSDISGDKDDKKMIQQALKLLGFGDGTEDTITEDEYDSAGLAVGVIYKNFVKQKETKKVKMKDDVQVGYSINQYDDMYLASAYAVKQAERFELPIHEMNLMEEKRDLKYHFRREVRKLDTDDRIFVVQIPTDRIGAVAMKKKLDLTLETSYLVIRKSSLSKKKQ